MRSVDPGRAELAIHAGVRVHAIALVRPVVVVHVPACGRPYEVVAVCVGSTTAAERCGTDRSKERQDHTEHPTRRRPEQVAFHDFPFVMSRIEVSNNAQLLESVCIIQYWVGLSRHYRVAEIVLLSSL